MTKQISVGHIDLSFHSVSAAVVELLFEKYGWKISNKDSKNAFPHEEMFKKFHNNEVDVLVSAWLPSSHGKYLNPANGNDNGENIKYKKLAVLYKPYCIWGVPDYIPQEVLSSVEDLVNKKELLETEYNFDKNIIGINDGAGITRFSKQMMIDYELESKGGYKFTSNNQPNEFKCFLNFEKNYEEKRWFVAPLWHPQFLHYKYKYDDDNDKNDKGERKSLSKIRALSEPKGILGGQDEATLIINYNKYLELKKDKESGELLDILSNKLYIGNDSVSEMDYYFCRENKTAREAAKIWLDRQKF